MEEASHTKKDPILGVNTDMFQLATFEEVQKVDHIEVLVGALLQVSKPFVCGERTSLRRFF
ncbi:hypothetical protein KSX_85900 [Ktedonospora formicarum]|uniref:Uncharacterized protein n=1 Tax=Ktedonospora formicarum TaxID=2778364 RepID=A0A8J3MVK9_9CHLR|nr:hypothetical protein KSX_85900 [Ktedonospora formicarum]